MGLNVNAFRLKRGFDALEEYNYFLAKKVFEKSKKRHLVAGTYGLSIIYQRHDNPFYNVDSAYNCIIESLTHYPLLNERKRLKYKKYGIDSLAIIRQRDLISEQLFERAVDVNSIYGFQDFIEKNPWHPSVNKAINYRDSLYFFEMHSIGKSSNYSQFLNTYPHSNYSKRAKQLFDKTFYQEQTIKDNINAYLTFLSVAPQSPFKVDAEDRIYELATQDKSSKAFSDFITIYPLNRNVNKAWRMLYAYKLQDNYSKENIQSFLVAYPDYPYKNDAENELKLEAVDFLRIRDGEKWGFISVDGKYLIPTKFDFVEDFSEGLALVRREDSLYYISKSGITLINLDCDDAFSFKNGYAIIEKNDKLGLINRVGERIINTIYDDLGNVFEGMSFFEENGKYGFFTKKGIKMIAPVFSDVSNFKNGIAVVKSIEKYTLIDKFGTPILTSRYDKVKQLDSNTLAVNQNGLWGVISMLEDTLVPFQYTFIKSASRDFYLVEKNEEFNFITKTTGQLISETWFQTFDEYREICEFDREYVKIKSENGYNFLNLNGTLLFKNNYAQLGKFKNYIAFQTNGSWGVLDTLGNVVIKPIYDLTSSFDLTGSIVELYPFKGVLNSKSEILFDLVFEELEMLNDSLLIVKSVLGYGLLNLRGDTLIQFNNKLIEPYSNSVVRIVNTDQIKYYNFVKQNWIKREGEE